MQLCSCAAALQLDTVNGEQRRALSCAGGSGVHPIRRATNSKRGQAFTSILGLANTVHSTERSTVLPRAAGRPYAGQDGEGIAMGHQHQVRPLMLCLQPRYERPHALRHFSHALPAACSRAGSQGRQRHWAWGAFVQRQERAEEPRLSHPAEYTFTARACLLPATQRAGQARLRTARPSLSLRCSTGGQWAPARPCSPGGCRLGSCASSAHTRS